MANSTRAVRPGSLVHVIVRFLNHERLLQDDTDRGEYLRRLGKALEKCDWKALAFALMSTHIHLCMLVGLHPYRLLGQTAHSPFAVWLNLRKSRFGPMVGKPPSIKEVHPKNCSKLLAYIHNNPVKAGVVTQAEHSTWTSHRGYLEQDPPPKWLDVNLGLQLADFEADEQGRRAFDAFVEQSRHEDWGAMLCPSTHREHRRMARESLGSAAELAIPRMDPTTNTLTYPVLTPEGVSTTPRWRGPAQQILAEVAAHTGVSVQTLQSRTRIRVVTAARRLAVLVFRDYLGRTLTEIAASMQITPSSASELAARATHEHHLVAKAMADEILSAQEGRIQIASTDQINAVFLTKP